jgi:hypothetical protein
VNTGADLASAVFSAGAVPGAPFAGNKAAPSDFLTQSPTANHFAISFNSVARDSPASTLPALMPACAVDEILATSLLELPEYGPAFVYWLDAHLSHAGLEGADLAPAIALA